jgi:GTP-binding protein
MRFVDEVAIRVRSGAGGRGMVCFHREKYVARGGPDGGDGGRGGDVVFVADTGLKTLLDFRYRRRYEAGNGAPGGRNRKTGRSGEDLRLRVPVGTVVSLADGEVLADLTVAGQQLVAAKGGKAGLGNSHFALPWRQAPDFSIPPGESEERELRLELKLLADIGIVGLPNAGKSTLINRISEARARVADYPFTTLVPNLGVVSAGPGRSFVVADMPGLIEGAAEGVGLGIQFLRHCERTRALVHLVDASAPGDPVRSLEVVERELAAHGAGLADKPVLIAANKVDMPGAEDAVEALREAARARGAPFHALSALDGRGVPELVFAMAALAFAPDGTVESESTITRS